jgi:polysaccharide export outer membrane protein
MNLGRLFILAFFVPGLLCQLQSQEPASKPAETSAPGATPSAQIPVAPVQPTPAQTAPPSPAPAQPASALAVEALPIPAPPAGVANDSYIIGASDVIAVTVWKEPTLSGSILVRPDGMISLPLLGDVRASGLTPLQLASQIATKLKKFMQDPNVSVVISAIHSKIIYLLGEVGKKGPIEMTPGMTLLEAIASAGGLTDYANMKKIYILRNLDGKHQKIPVHYKQALKGNSDLNLALESGDTIVVP